MLVMLDKGHTLHCLAMKNRLYHLAIGTLPAGYPDVWSSETPNSASEAKETVLTRSTGTLTDTLPNVGVIKIIYAKYQSTVYVQDIDYTLVQNTIEWKDTGQRPPDGAVYNVAYRFINLGLTELVQEVARRRATNVNFAEESPQGTIAVGGKYWSIVEYPTPYLYLNFEYDVDEALNYTIYQTGVFVDTVLKEGVSTNLYYITPDQIANKGYLYLIENVIPFARVQGKREKFEYILNY
jgi:hypothetical protein